MIALVCIFSAFSVTLGQEQCTSALEEFSSGLVSDIQNNGTEYLMKARDSGKGLNELGHYRDCLRQKEMSYYLLRQTGDKFNTVVGICVPSECSAEDIESLISPLSSEIQFSVEVPSEINPSFGTWVVYFLLFTLLILGSMGSYYELHSLEDEHKIICAFSFVGNYKRLAETKPKDKDTCQDTSDCLNGLRVLFISWIILGLSYGFRAHSAVINVEELHDILGTAWTMTAYGAFFAVDAFFWLGGFLVGYLILSKYEKRRGKLGCKGWVLILVHRFLRIVPVYVFMMMVYNWLVPTLSSGPLWNEGMKDLNESCGEYWWTNLIFLNNFLPHGLGNKCFGIGWYLANDMQFFWTGPIFIWIYFNLNKVISWVLYVMLLVAGVIINTSIAAEFDFRLNVLHPNNYVDSGKEDLYYEMYTKPYCRYPAYLIGIFTGFLYLRHLKMQDHDPYPDYIASRIIRCVKYSKVAAIGSFVVGIFMMLFFVLIQRPVYLDSNMDGMTPFGNYILLGTYRTGFCIGLTAMVLPILLGHFRPLYKFLAADIWGMFAKITFCCFLVAYCLLKAIYSSEEGSVVYSGHMYFRDWVVGSAISWPLALALYLLVENPFSNLERMLCRKGKRK